MSNSSAAPRAVAHQALLSMGFPRQEYWSGLPFPPPGRLPNPGTESLSPVSHLGSQENMLPRSKASEVLSAWSVVQEGHGREERVGQKWKPGLFVSLTFPGVCRHFLDKYSFPFSWNPSGLLRDWSRSGQFIRDAATASIWREKAFSAPQRITVEWMFEDHVEISFHLPEAY